MCGVSPLRFANYDVAIRAVDDCLQFRLFRRGYAELVERLLEIIHEGLPLFWRNVHVTMRVGHRASGVFLWAARRHPDHLGNQIFETGWRNLVVRFVHGRVGVQARISHDAIDEIIDHRRDAINPAETLVEGRLICLSWHGDAWMCFSGSWTRIITGFGRHAALARSPAKSGQGPCVDRLPA